jgi:hypothetical protein
VTEAEYEVFIAKFPDRKSYVTGICEPPQRISEWPPSSKGKPGRPIASIAFGDWPEGRKNPDWDAKVYKINEDAEPPA